MPSSNPLPPKENALFKRILKCYEQKQYKNGLKFSKQILSNPKFQEHGETLAMKGLTLNCLGRKEEAYDFVRRGLRNDLRSHVCWHVFGLLQRSDKKYDEAIKCYRNALKWDSENIQILRDLSLLQIQMRDLEGYKDTRYQLFHLRPTQRASWIGFAMSYHLLKDYEMALKLLEEFRKTQQKNAYDYEHSELLLYQNMVMQESGDLDGALEHLETYKDQICDKVTWLETKGAQMLMKDKREDAEKIFRELADRNPENHAYYFRLLEATAAQTTEQKLALFDEYKAKFPKAQTPQRLALDAAQVADGTFRKLVDDYMMKALRKGIPPLFVDLKPLYADLEKVRVIEELVHGYEASLSSPDSTFHPLEKGGQTEEEKEPATAYLWVLYFLSQHYDYKKDHKRALELVNKAIEHTPTLIELFLLKGKIYKHIGNMEEAVLCLDESQSLDTADRYINCKCAKYLLRANMVPEAEAMCQKFTREGVAAMENLNEMQCMWFQTECAGAYKRVGKFGEALKKCIEVDRHFTEIIEDQFDFHTYCMRKMTLRSYMDLLRLEDELRSHKFYKKAAHTAINVYLKLHDNPLKDMDNLNVADAENMDPSELKKLRNKQKKAKRKAEQEKQSAKEAAARKELHNKSQKLRNANEENDPESPTKDELVPEKLERPEEPLAEAIKFLLPLQQFASKDIRTHLLAFEIYHRRGKPLLMLQSVKRALALDPADPRVQGCVLNLQLLMEEKRSKMASPVLKVLDNATKSIFTAKSAKEGTDLFIQKNANSLQHSFVGAKLMALLEPSNTEKAVRLVTKLDSTLSNVSIQLCSEILESLEDGKFGAEGVSAAVGYRKKCAGHFELSSVFNDPSSSSPSKKGSNNNNSSSSSNGGSGNAGAAKEDATSPSLPPPASAKEASAHINNSSAAVQPISSS